MFRERERERDELKLQRERSQLVRSEYESAAHAIATCCSQ